MRCVGDLPICATLLPALPFLCCSFCRSPRFRLLLVLPGARVIFRGSLCAVLRPSWASFLILAVLVPKLCLNARRRCSIVPPRSYPPPGSRELYFSPHD